LNANVKDATSEYDGADVPLAEALGQAPATRPRLLVLPSSSEYDLDLLHVAQRLAAALDADWTVVHVQTSSFRFLPDRDRDRRSEITRMAESLGGEAVVLHGTSAARTVAAYARLRRAAKILIGSPDRLSLEALCQYARIASLRRCAPGIDILVVAPRDRLASIRDTRDSPPVRAQRASIRWSRYVWGLGTTAVCTAAAFPIAAHVDLINVVMIYMLGMAAAGLWLGRGPSALAAVANTVAFDFFFVPPRYSLMVIDASYLVTFAVMLLVALIIANLMIAVREQTEAAGRREQHTTALYAITCDLAAMRDAKSMAELAVRRIGEELQYCALMMLCDADGRLDTTPLAASSSGAPLVNAATARWVAANRQRAGAGAREFSDEPAIYLPLLNVHMSIGVLVVQHVEPNGSLQPEQHQLLETLAGQLASALERARLTEIAHAAHLTAERAAMRNTLLASISHDLRTPLSAIAGAGSIVAQHDFALDIYRRVMLGRLIEDKARNMSELLSNVLELVRLESGADVLNRDWHTLIDLIGQAICRHEARLAGWHIITDVPEDLPMLSVDGTLFVQLLGNLLENAAKYTPPNTCITISATACDDTIRLVVEDDGPGWATDNPEQLFEKFSRCKTESSAGGVGLGLAICKAVVRLHAGQIRAAESRHGGARIEIDIPLPESEWRQAALESLAQASPAQASQVFRAH
jgi:two-component system, OmpR family, sensor histidine kinase KdpD